MNAEFLKSRNINYFRYSWWFQPFFLKRSWWDSHSQCLQGCSRSHLSFLFKGCAVTCKQDSSWTSTEDPFWHLYCLQCWWQWLLMLSAWTHGGLVVLTDSKQSLLELGLSTWLDVRAALQNDSFPQRDKYFEDAEHLSKYSGVFNSYVWVGKSPSLFNLSSTMLLLWILPLLNLWSIVRSRHAWSRCFTSGEKRRQFLCHEMLELNFLHPSEMYLSLSN